MREPPHPLCFSVVGQFPVTALIRSYRIGARSGTTSCIHISERETLWKRRVTTRCNYCNGQTLENNRRFCLARLRDHCRVLCPRRVQGLYEALWASRRCLG